MNKIYRIITKMGIFGYCQEFKNKPLDESKYKPGRVKCIEYVKIDDAKLK